MSSVNIKFRAIPSHSESERTLITKNMNVTPNSGLKHSFYRLPCDSSDFHRSKRHVQKMYMTTPIDSTRQPYEPACGTVCESVAWNVAGNSSG